MRLPILSVLSVILCLLANPVSAKTEGQGGKKAKRSTTSGRSAESAGETRQRGQTEEQTQGEESKTKTETKVWKKLTEEVNKVRQAYRKHQIEPAAAWDKLAALQQKNLSRLGKHPGILQMKSYLLQEENYYTLSLIYAREAIEAAKDPFGENMNASWHLLFDALRKGDNDDLLFELGATFKDVEKLPYGMGRNWYYYRAKAFSDAGKFKKANALLAKIQTTDFIYLAARYELAMNYVQMNKIDDAYKTFSALTIAVRSNVQAFFSNENRMEIVQLARLGMARIDYEREKYIDAIKHYRQVRRESSRFYTTLAEQSWALFMAGFPNHALGTIYSAQSPFFEDRFNPELSLLKSIIYFWMCRYEDSRIALISFIDNFSEPVKDLEGFLEKKKLGPMEAYQLFENAMSGVSSESLGISRELLLSVAQTELMTMHRFRLAKAIEESERLNTKGIWKPGYAPREMQTILDQRLVALKKGLGEAYLQELEGLRQEYKRLRNQLDFLYVELLLSEKEKLFGREMHGNTKMKKIPEKSKVSGWGRQAQSWAGSDKDEFWIDEIGFYIFDLESQCK